MNEYPSMFSKIIEQCKKKFFTLILALSGPFYNITDRYLSLGINPLLHFPQVEQAKKWMGSLLEYFNITGKTVFKTFSQKAETWQYKIILLSSYFAK